MGTCLSSRSAPPRPIETTESHTSQAGKCWDGLYGQATRQGLEAQQHAWIPLPRTDGRLWSTGPVVWECLITWTRLRKWRDSLPDEIVDTAKKCRKPDGDIGYVNSGEAWEWRRQAVDMAIEASRHRAWEQLDLFAEAS